MGVTRGGISGGEGTPLPGSARPMPELTVPCTRDRRPERRRRKPACDSMCSTSQGLSQNPESQTPQPLRDGGK